jgi:uncharacterized membrane protein HdeD (DUF308 family)
MDQFVMGATTMASFVVGLFFLRFWNETRDRLFGAFAIAFWLLGVTRLVMAVTSGQEHQNVYWLRLIAFALILVAIIDKNRPARNAAAQENLREGSPPLP